jgi:asparagine synthase (glutamine-hydrolysing)
MCGIAGVYNFSNPRLILEAMHLRMAHRGPDAAGIYIDEKFSLGLTHRRLAILDLTSAGEQPFHSQCGRYAMVYNGEVYNFKAIALQLSQTFGIQFKSGTDTEIVLEAFVHWGPSFIHKLNGMFAMAIFDKQTGLLQLWRDRLGIKPLYYWSDQSKFCFGSEPEVLRQTKEINQIEKKAIPAFFHLGYVPAPLSIWKGMFKLKPGETVTFDGFNLETQRWWDPALLPLERFEGSEIEAVSQLEALISDSVSLRLVADVPFGTFLSGGVDSSLVTALAAKAYGPGLKTFSIAMDEGTHNEAEYAKAVSAHLKTEHIEFSVSANEGLKWVELLPDIFQEPFADSSAIPSLMVSDLAKKSATMVLTGDGGDELFHGYGAYRWASRLSGVKGQVLNRVAPLFRLGNERYKRIGELLGSKGKSSLQAHIFSQEQYLFSAPELSELLSSDILFEVPDYNESQTLLLSPSEKQAWFDLQLYLPDDLLVKVDRATMHFALEARVPLLDFRLVQFALALPTSMKYKEGCAKYILKQVLYKHVPSKLFNRPKWGFSIPLVKWMQKELKPLLDEWVGQPEHYRHGFLNYNHAILLLNRFNNGETRLYNRLWLIIQFNLWYARYH